MVGLAGCRYAGHPVVGAPVRIRGPGERIESSVYDARERRQRGVALVGLFTQV